MLTGKNLLSKGWPQGPLIGLALEAAKTLSGCMSDDEIVSLLERVRQHPSDFATPGHELAPLAQGFLALRVQKNNEVREVPLDAPVWGEDLIDPRAVSQLHNAMRLPVTVAGALMPDAHVGYGIPIGGVVALEGAVAPFMVGVDIACRMMMSIYPLSPDAVLGNDTQRGRLRHALRSETRFGVGAEFEPGKRRQHEVLDDTAWQGTKLLRGLQDKAYAQLGTSGSGNHFVDAGVLTVKESDAEAVGVEAGDYFAVMTHSGSRGVGAKIADTYAKLAERLSDLPKEFKHLAWLSLESEAGREYWLSMNLAGRFASANHHTIHQALSKRLGIEPIKQLENHHNFAWLEAWGDREVVVHRKGATPAHEGVLGIVPGSQGHPSFIVQGKGNERALNSASHGAGRTMSRTQAKATIPKEARQAWLKEQNVELLGSGMDEAPQAYKDIERVLDLQEDLVSRVATFMPRMVLMAEGGRAED